MCGIAGWVGFRHDLSTEQARIDAMTETMACRGPDARGTWSDRHAALGHRRLSIIDLERGTQPMTLDTPEGTLALTYSGEVYNYTELRAELRRNGHVFRTDSDTEVVLHGYLQWGEALAEKLNGMYAFAIWDSRTERLVMVRDRMGIKPFYRYTTADGVLFGSEPKAILANPLARKVIDADSLREALSFSKTPGHAIFSGMREVLPGTVVTVDSAGLREHTYWKLQATPHTDGRDATVAKVRELMEDIVRRQLVADVPRCVLLSGGLDSSAVTGLAARQLAEQDEKVRTFAVDFVGQTENFTPDDMRATPDGPYVHDVAEHVGSQHADIVLDAETLADPDIRKAVVTARDLPVGLGDIDQSLYLLFREIRKHSTVALSGESADEVFGGYKWFHDPEVQQANKFPWVAQAIKAMPAEDRSVASPLRCELTSRLALESYLADTYAAAKAEVPRLDGESAFEAKMREICYLHLTRFVRVLLDRKDRASMAVGLEVRVPFCDHRLVEYVFNTPWSLKTFDGREKSLLRHATKHVLPQSVVDRVKSPYPSTQDMNYVRAIQQQAADVAADSNHPAHQLIDEKWLATAVKTDVHEMGPATRHGIERVLNLAVWLDEYRPELKL
ncbi:MAG: asparagine synthase (glutamine-hydrolyzing) [Sciscionella sp.]